MTGFVAETAYAIALCFYQQKAYGPALKHIAEIIEKGVREHPELSVGSQSEGVEVRLWELLLRRESLSPSASVRLAGGPYRSEHACFRQALCISRLVNLILRPM
eukprot:scaffold14039_cov37-Tisochrysis_lutea.AAC.4